MELSCSHASPRRGRYAALSCLKSITLTWTSHDYPKAHHCARLQPKSDHMFMVGSVMEPAV
jgi:hypothetical protein